MPQQQPNPWLQLAQEIDKTPPAPEGAATGSASPEVPTPATAPARSGVVGEFASSAWDQVNPVNIVKGLWKAGGDAVNAGGKLLHGDVAGAMGSIPLVSDEARRIKGVWTRPDSGGVNDRPLNRAVESIPLVGGIMRQASDQSLEGNWGGAAGTLAGAGAAMVLGPKGVKAGGAAIKSKLLQPAARTILGPSMSDAARKMTGQTGRSAPGVMRRIVGKEGPLAADDALARTAMDTHSLPRFWDPRKSPSEKALGKAEQGLQSALDDTSRYPTRTADQAAAWERTFKRTGDEAAATAAASKVPTSWGEKINVKQGEVNRTPFVRSVLDDTDQLNVQTRLKAREDMKPYLESGDGPSQTGSRIATEVAAERPRVRGMYSEEADWKGNMARAQLQGRRQVLADKLDAAGQHALADQVRQVQSLAALDVLYAKHSPMMSGEGIPTMQARQAIGIINRGAALPVRAGVRMTDAMQRTGQWADDAAYRKAMLAALAQSGRGQEER